MLSERAKNIINRGNERIRVKRTGMLQYMNFTVKRVNIGSDTFVELFSDRHLDSGELQRVADETGLPVEAEKLRAFPKGTGAKDFIGL